MKNLFYTLILSIVCYSGSLAQIRAITEQGDTIYVYSDGTWSYDKETEPGEINELDFLNSETSFDTLKTKLKVQNISSKKSLKSNLEFFEIYYDSDEWRRLPAGQLNEDAEFALQHKIHDIYAIIISEEIDIGMENIYKIAINTMEQSTGSKVKIIKSEIVNVNNTDVIHASFEVSMQGMNLIFDSYYFSDARGTIQFTTWTGSNIFKKYERKVKDLLTGLIVK